MKNLLLFVLVLLGNIISQPLLAEPTATLLESCWTREQLKGNASEKIVQRIRTDHTPPRYDSPHVSLPVHNNNKSIRSVTLPANTKVIAITFDLCEQAGEKTGYDGQLIDYLRDNRVKATFFAGGKWLRSHAERAKQLLADPLFELGNHAWTHGNLRVLRGSAVAEQIRWTQVQYEILRDELLNAQCALPFKTQATQAIPPVPELFRFPYGTCNADSLAAVSQQGLAAVQWNIVSGDPAKGQSANAIAKTILQQAKAGAIIVAHANGRGWHTAEALPKIVNELRKRGYDFVKVSELLKMGNPVAVDSCYENKPNDNLRYDRLFTRRKK